MTESWISRALILVEQRSLPFVHINLFFQFGPIFDPPGKQGLSQLCHRMLMRGTQRRDRSAFEEAVEILGTEVHSLSQQHAQGIGGFLLSRKLPQFLDLLGEMLTQPAFEEEEIERVKREMLAELETAQDEDSVLARIWFQRLLFWEHPIAYGVSISKESLAAIRREDLLEHFQRFYHRGCLSIGAAGDISRGALEGMLTRSLEALPEGPPTSWELPPQNSQEGPKLFLLDRMERGQIQLFLGQPSVKATHPDHSALRLAVTAFGGTFTARLMQEVRVKRGLSYGAYARLGTERFGASLMINAVPERKDAVQTLRLLLSEYRRFIEEGLSDEEINFARGYLGQAQIFAMETATQRAALQTRARLLGHPDDFLERYLEHLSALSADQVRAAVRRHLDPQRILAIMVGSLGEVEQELSALGLFSSIKRV